jgi:hypothetical protein
VPSTQNEIGEYHESANPWIDDFAHAGGVCICSMHLQPSSLPVRVGFADGSVLSEAVDAHLPDSDRPTSSAGAVYHLTTGVRGALISQRTRAQCFAFFVEGLDRPSPDVVMAAINSGPNSENV